MTAGRIVSVAVIAALTLAAAACGDGDTTAGTPTSPTATGDGSPAPSPTGTAAEPTGDATQGFATLAERGFEARARVSYRVTSAGTEETLTFSSDGQRTAILYPGGRVIVTAEGATIACITEGPAQCFEFPQAAGGAQNLAGAFAGPFVGLATAFESDAAVVPGFSLTGERDIAGRTATCATFDPSRLAVGTTGGEATLCVDADTGLILLYEVTAEDGSWRMEALEVGEPSDEDFEPPAPPQPAPGGGS